MNNSKIIAHENHPFTPWSVSSPTRMFKTALLVMLSFLLITTCQSRSSRKIKEQPVSTKEIRQQSHAAQTRSRIVVAMTQNRGVYEIPVIVNCIAMHFIFDTGASNVSLSETEATIMYRQGLITDDDIKGSKQFVDANGDINEGTIINLKEINIGGRVVKNVSASVVHSQNAPLLLGQSLMERFGKFTMDYKKATITFE